MDTIKETTQETFRKFCFEKFVAYDCELKRSRTITREKAEKIMKLLKKDPLSILLIQALSQGEKVSVDDVLGSCIT